MSHILAIPTSPYPMSNPLISYPINSFLTLSAQPCTAPPPPTPTPPEDSSGLEDAVLLESWQEPAADDVTAALNQRAEQRQQRGEGGGGAGGKAWGLW